MASASPPPPPPPPPPAAAKPLMLDVLGRLVSSSVGSVATVLLTSPLDVLKTRRQAAPAAPAVHGALSLLAPPPPPGGSGVRALASLVQREGMRVLWSGLGPALAATVPSTALYFTAYDLLKRGFEGALADSAALPAAPLLAGVAGRTIAVAAVSPLELIRTREMLSRSRLPLLAALRAEVVAGGSVAALWRGFAATLWRDVPFSGVYWLGYEHLKHAGGCAVTAAHARHRARGGGGGGGESPPSLLDTFAVAFAAGATSGSVAAFLTTPFDVVRTRRQVEGMAGTAAAATGGTAATLLAIARSEGLAGLFAGVGARVAKVAPSCAIMISSYEACKRVLRADE